MQLVLENVFFYIKKGDFIANSPILETLRLRLPGLFRTFPKPGEKCCKMRLKTFIKL